MFSVDVKIVVFSHTPQKERASKDKLSEFACNSSFFKWKSAIRVVDAVH